MIRFKLNIVFFLWLRSGYRKKAAAATILQLRQTETKRWRNFQQQDLKQKNSTNTAQPFLVKKDPSNGTVANFV